MKKFISFLKSQKGQGTVEYALITLAIVAIIIAVLMATNNPLRTAIQGAFDKVVTQVNTQAA